MNFPFSAIVGQDELKLALVLAAIDPTVGGVLVLGDRGTGKSTAVRALAALLPPIRCVEGCLYGCDPSRPDEQCESCASRSTAGKIRIRQGAVPVVDLPLGATEDRVVGALDLEKALLEGTKSFEPGLLARANRGFLYIDEVNLLEDHLVDLLIDVAASGQNVVERDGLSVRHPARFVLVGSGNPEEGELRPQLLDRFGLALEIRAPKEMVQRVEVIKRRDAYERNPREFVERWRPADERLRRKIIAARKRISKVVADDQTLEDAATLCASLGTDGLRGELTLIRAARALASLDRDERVGRSHMRRVAACALRHRLRRNPLDETASGTRVDRAMGEVWPH